MGIRFPWLSGAAGIQLDAIVLHVVANTFGSGLLYELTQFGQCLLLAWGFQAHAKATLAIDHGPAAKPELRLRCRLALDVANPITLEAHAAPNMREGADVAFAAGTTWAFNFHSDCPSTDSMGQ